MHIKLSDNIRAFRKARSLTQQQLADAMGVTVGAVYKWEANLSAPDLSLLVELADLFDTSVDVLLGYEIKDNKQKAMTARLKELMRDRDDRALAEAEKALVRYPNCFEIVQQCASLYHVFGLIDRNRELLQRAVQLTERAILFIDQNTDPQISELSLYIEMANIYFGMGEAEKALEILKGKNPCGMNDALIGQTLASVCNLPEEAVPYLSMGLLNTIASLIRITSGYYNVYSKKREYAEAVDILRAALVFFDSFREPEKSSFLDRISAAFHLCLAHMQIERGESDEARKSLRTAKREAEAFDRMPDYQGNSIRFVSENAMTVFDDMGGTAKEAIQHLLRDIGSEPLLALWEEIDHAG